MKKNTSVDGNLCVIVIKMEMFFFVFLLSFNYISKKDSWRHTGRLRAVFTLWTKFQLERHKAASECDDWPDAQLHAALKSPRPAWHSCRQ